MAGKEKFNKKKNLSSRVSVFVSDNKNVETINVNDIDMKITKLNSMINAVERRVEAHQKRLSNIYDSAGSRETREYMSQSDSNMSSGQ